ncbi:MAG TPA: helix-turn-helix transcriptional regulator [bacterium]|nr:helix-turn-helix transcriptional regulator [bacterium]
MSHDAINPLGEELKRWCKAHGITQSALAMKLGISASHLSQVINGQARPSPALVRRIRELISAHALRHTGANAPSTDRVRLRS